MVAMQFLPSFFLNIYIFFVVVVVILPRFGGVINLLARGRRRWRLIPIGPCVAGSISFLPYPARTFPIDVDVGYKRRRPPRRVLLLPPLLGVGVGVNKQ